MADSKRKTNGASPWRNRIVGSGTANPADLMPNPLNWRTHPDEQREALGDVLTEVGWVQQVVVNRTTGHLLDGHLRVDMARRNKVAEVPVEYVELTEEEEQLVLLTLDPIAAMATTSASKVSNLLQTIQTESTALMGLMKNLAPPIIPNGATLPPLDIPSGTVRDQSDDDDSYDDDDDGDSTPLEQSNVRMVSLFLDTNTHPEFMRHCVSLQAYFGTENLTDTVFEAVAHAYRHCQ